MRAWLLAWWTRRLPAQNRIRLSQRHIFIVPTAAGYAFFIALLLMLLLAINYQNSLAYALTFLLGSIGLLGILHTWRNLAGLKLTGLPPEPCFAGETARVEVRLQAERHSYQAIGLGWSRHELHRCDVAQNDQNLLSLSLSAVQRGRHKVARMRVETRFPLGIWVAWSYVDLAQSLLVYPQPIEAELTVQQVSADRQVDGLSTAGHGVDDYQGLQAWQSGNSLQRINWKVWSKGQGLWVKQFVGQQGSQLQLDYSSLAGDMEYRLSVLCAQVIQLTQQEVTFSLCLPGQTLGPAAGAGHCNECLTALALFGGTHG